MNGNDLELVIGSARFRNPVFLASGPAGYGMEYEGLVDIGRLGAIVTKTVTLYPRKGNPGRRLAETEAGLLNSVGLENVGAGPFFAEKLPALVEAGATPIVSLAAESWDEYCRLLELTADEKTVEAVEINLSCPNIDAGGMTVGKDPDLVKHYVIHAKDVLGGRAVIAKLTPNVSDLTTIAMAAEEGGADAVTAINTVLGLDIDTAGRRPVFRRVVAGLSGPAVRPIALLAVWRTASALDIPVIGVGGISSPDDARKFFMAGASAVQIGTAIFYDTALPESVIEMLENEGLPRRVI